MPAYPSLEIPPPRTKIGGLSRPAFTQNFYEVKRPAQSPASSTSATVSPRGLFCDPSACSSRSIVAAGPVRASPSWLSSLVARERNAQGAILLLPPLQRLDPIWPEASWPSLLADALAFSGRRAIRPIPRSNWQTLDTCFSRVNNKKICRSPTYLLKRNGNKLGSGTNGAAADRGGDRDDHADINYREHGICGAGPYKVLP
jgi:hypothetical protein